MIPEHIEIPDVWAALGGRFDVSVANDDSFIRDEALVRVTHRISPSMKIGGWVPMSREMLEDVGPEPDIVERHMARALDRHFRPWLYPRVSPFPAITLFPRWDRFVAWLRRRFGR